MLSVPSGHYHLLVNPLCVKHLLWSRMRALRARVFSFLVSVWPKVRWLLLFICCLNQASAVDSFVLGAVGARSRRRRLSQALLWCSQQVRQPVTLWDVSVGKMWDLGLRRERSRSVLTLEIIRLCVQVHNRVIWFFVTLFPLLCHSWFCLLCLGLCSVKSSLLGFSS